MNTFKQTHNQRGMVSIMVTMLMMIVISVTVLSFAQVSRREQRSTLDRQLSMQAFYAAETGVNDVAKIVNQQLAAGGGLTDKTTCDNTGPYAGLTALSAISTARSVSYSCVLVSSKAQSLTQDVKAAGPANIFPLHPDGAPLTDVHFDWSIDTPPTSLSGCKTAIPNSGDEDSFANTNSWNCPYGVLRIDIVPTDAGRLSQLTVNQKTFFLYPLNAVSGTLSYGTVNGGVFGMGCSVAAKMCSADLTGLNMGSDYTLRATSVYNDGTLTISGKSGGSPIDLKDAQLTVDVTGKAQDILRRIRVALPLSRSSDGSKAALVSGSSICKRFGVSSDSFVISSGLLGQDSNNPLCKATAVTPPPPPCAVGNDIVLALDHSESMTGEELDGKPRIDALKAVTKKFVQNTNVGAYNHEAIITFSGPDDAVLRQPLTDQVPPLVNVIDNIGKHFGTTYIPALKKADASGWSTGIYRPSAKKVLVFVTDGYNKNESASSILAEANLLKSKGIVIYTIGINDAGGGNGDFSLLRDMASAPSSTYFADVNSTSSLNAMFDKIASNVSCSSP